MSPPIPTGTELRDPDHAWEGARETIRAMTREAGAQGRPAGAHCVVTGAAREVVLAFPFAEAPPPDRGGVH